MTRGLRGVGCLDIHGVGIRVDAAGRYCLNDLHRSAGGQAKDQPAFFMRRRETADLVAELSNTENSRVSPELGASAISQTPVATLNNGSNNGTYVVKELVYAYAMWISASFHLKVIRAYDAMVAVQPAPGFAISQTLSEALRRRGHIVASISQFGRDRDNAI
ncbi:KilA-N domain-containing protein [Cupriavidus pinatubonensis]|uniref:KilA-N domain-containing protein n=1 Tax=Cupriavidus pinatubonensis TaxID=248026 RepID=UPI001CC67061|nr:KilA-N domain-containing protein [Cupriavidus pinatubonensis]